MRRPWPTGGCRAKNQPINSALVGKRIVTLLKMHGTTIKIKITDKVLALLQTECVRWESSINVLVQTFLEMI
jgi:hypothetical protein